MTKDEAIAEVSEAEPSRSAVKSAQRFVEGFSYTTTAMRAIAQVLQTEFDDPEGARLLREFCLRFAAHEAEQI